MNTSRTRRLAGLEAAAVQPERGDSFRLAIAESWQRMTADTPGITWAEAARTHQAALLSNTEHRAGGVTW